MEDFVLSFCMYFLHEPNHFLGRNKFFISQVTSPDSKWQVVDNFE